MQLQQLKYNGIQTNIHYPIVPHKQGVYKEVESMNLPITEKIHREIISLPIRSVLTKEAVKKVLEIVNE